MPTQLFTTTFAGTATTPDTRIGSTAGVGSDWQDFSSGAYHLSSGLVSSGDGRGALMRPSWETTAGSIVEAVFTMPAYPPPYFEIYARWNPIIAAGYALIYVNGDLCLQRRGRGVSRGVSSAQNHYYPYTVGADYAFRLWIAPSANGRSTVIATMALASAPTTYLAACALPDDDLDQGQLLGQVGIAVANGAALVRFTHFDLGGDAMPAVTLPMSVSPIRFISSTPATITLATGNHAGGTGSRRQQWYRDVVADFAPSAGNAIAGQTAAQLTDTPSVAGVRYFYKLVVTDSSATPISVASNELVARTAGAPLRVGIVSDSTLVLVPADGTQSVGTAMISSLGRLGNLQSVTVDNRGVGGTVTADWLDGGTLATSAQASFAATPPDVIVVHLGVNDAQNNVDAAVFANHLANIVAWCRRYSGRVVLDEPQSVEQCSSNNFANHANELILRYLDALENAIDGRTVFRGAGIFDFTTRQSYRRIDGLHFGAAGVEQAADMIADAALAAVAGPGGNITATFGHFRARSSTLSTGAFAI